MVEQERTLENMHLMEVKDMLKSKPGLFRKIPKCYSPSEYLEFEKRGLLPMYEYFGQHGDVICSRVETALGLHAASEGLQPYSREVLDQVIVKWSEGLKKGEVLSLIEILNGIENP